MVTIDYDKINDEFLRRSGMALAKMKREITKIAQDVGVIDEKVADAMTARMLIGAVAAMLGAEMGRVVPSSDEGLTEFSLNVIAMVAAWDPSFCPSCELDPCQCGRPKA